MSRRLIPAAALALVAGIAGPVRFGGANPKGAPVREARRDRDRQAKFARREVMLQRAEAKRKRKAERRRRAS